jgi:hypothetical protein
MVRETGKPDQAGGPVYLRRRSPNCVRGHAMQSGEQCTRADAVLEQRRNGIGACETYLNTSAMQGAALLVCGACKRRLYALLATTAQRNSAALRPAVDWAECEASSSLGDVRRASPQRRRAKVGGFMHQRALSACRGAFLSATALAQQSVFVLCRKGHAAQDPSNITIAVKGFLVMARSLLLPLARIFASDVIGRLLTLSEAGSFSRLS